MNKEMNKKIFTAKQFITLLVFIVILIGLWAVFAFLVKEDYLSRIMLWATLVFGTGTIITSVLAIGISILTIKKDTILRHQKIEEDANRFIIENNDELLYIPLCLIANAFNNHHRYIRKIYNSFNVLNKDVQIEVLKQLNYECDLIKNNAWIDSGIKLVQSFIADNDLGPDFLYDGAKYFHRALRYSSLDYDARCEYEHFMPDVFNWNPKIFFVENQHYSEHVSFYDYLDSYLTSKEKVNLHKDKKPLSVLATLKNLRDCPEEEICYWMMEVVASISTLLIKKKTNGDSKRMSSSDAPISTFEDRYLDVLMDLYNLASFAGNQN